MAEINPDPPLGFYGKWVEVTDFSKYNLDENKLAYSSALNNAINGAVESVTARTKELVSQNQNQQFVFLIDADLSQYAQEIYLMKKEGVNISKINYAYGGNKAYVRDGTSWMECSVSVLEDAVKFLCGIVYQFEIWPGYNPTIPDWVYFDYCYEVSTGKYYEDNGDGEWVEVSTIPSNIEIWIEEALLKKPSIVDIVYPVGSIYMSVNNTDPSILFGGEWRQLEDKFLLGSGASYTNGSTGGEATHTLTENEMPSHTHTQAQHRHKQQSKYSSGTGSAGAYIHTSNRTAVDHYTDYQTPKINNTGGGKAHNNMPPYLVVNMWKRTG